MTHFYGPLTTNDRDSLCATADALCLIPVTRCPELASALSCIAQTRNPDQALIEAALDDAKIVQRALLAEAAPDRWVDEVSMFDPETQDSIITGLIEQRAAQASQVDQAIALLKPLARTESAIPA